MNRLLVVAALLASTASPAAGQERARDATETVVPLAIGETFTIASEALHEDRRINVYLPAGYTESPDMRLPVLYMPDGGIKEDFLHVAGLIQVLVGNGTMRPFLLVGIENTERRRDMTGPTDVERDKRIAVRVGGSAAFRRFIRTELMPRVKARYRTTAETAVVGESLAGLFVVETFFREPDLFDSYIAFDPSLWWNNHRLVTEADSLLRARPAGRKTLYLASSAEPELADLTQRLATVLRERAFPGLRWDYIPMPEESHATIYHPAALRAFRTVFAPDSARSPASRDEQEIRAARAAFNAAIARHDIPSILTFLEEEFHASVSSGDFVNSRREMGASFATRFAEFTDARYVRTPEAVDVSSMGPFASEHGTWVGSWTTPTGPYRIGGRYSAYWRRSSRKWLLHAELYVPLFCEGAACS